MPSVNFSSVRSFPSFLHFQITEPFTQNRDKLFTVTEHFSHYFRSFKSHSLGCGAGRVINLKCPSLFLWYFRTFVKILDFCLECGGSLFVIRQTSNSGFRNQLTIFIIGRSRCFFFRVPFSNLARRLRFILVTVVGDYNLVVSKK
jgi:hypothetical protein